MVDCIEAFSAGIADKREEGRSVYHSEKTDRPLLAFQTQGNEFRYGNVQLGLRWNGGPFSALS